MNTLTCYKNKHPAHDMHIIKLTLNSLIKACRENLNWWIVFFQRIKPHKVSLFDPSIKIHSMEKLESGL